MDALNLSLSGRLGTFEMDVSFRVPMRGITGLFGQSGSGKTTILRCIAGLERLEGRISLGNEIWQDTKAATFVPTHKRHVGYVFQEASLFPHISVEDNLLYGARRAGSAGSPPGFDLDHIVGLLGIGRLLQRSPTTLSGGERQRVAVGRALLARPRVLLMDEPLSALDRMTKEEILPYFEMLHERLSLPVVYVTHDFAELERLADALVLLDKGKLVAAGPLHELQTNTALPLIAAPEASVVLTGRVAGYDPQFQLSRLSIDGGELLVPGRAGEIGDARRLRIVATDVSIARAPPADTTILNCIAMRIVTIDQRENAPQANVILALGAAGEGSRIGARVTRKSISALGLRPGIEAFAQIKSVALVATRPSHSGPAS